jgi:acyl-CoA oxidase
VDIPVENLLNRFGWIDTEGKYQSVTKDNDRRFGLFMTALSSGRAIVGLGSNCLAINAITIALRYACSRKQF